MSRIPFGDALADLLLLGTTGGDPRMQVTDLRLDVPIEVALADVDGVPTLYAHPRRWRLQTVFDARPGRLVVRAGSVG